MGQAKQTHRPLTYLLMGALRLHPSYMIAIIAVTEKSRWVLSFKTQPNLMTLPLIGGVMGGGEYKSGKKSLKTL